MRSDSLSTAPQTDQTALFQQGSRLVEKLQGIQAAGPQPGPIPVPTPVPIPLFRGSRFLIWKQDPTVSTLGIRTTYIPTLVLNGPTDSRILTELAGTTPVNRNLGGDFLFPVGSPEFDCAHTFAVVRQTLTMWERLMGGTRVPWAWNTGGNTDRITVHPRAGETANAFYSRGERVLKFFFFTPSGTSSPVFTCRSLDIVSHEAGHAILDGLKPGWLGFGQPPETGGLHEAFGDLTAIFVALSQLDQAETFIAVTKANLHAKNFLSALAEQFGSAIGVSMGLRNADNDFKLSEVSNEVHAISQVFTGGIYDVLADVYAFEKNQQISTKDPAQILVEVAQDIARLLIQAIVAAPASGATYADIVNQMLTISHGQGDPPIYRSFIRNRFTFREVVVSPTPLTAMAEGKVDYTDPDFREGEDLIELKAMEHPGLKASQDRSGCCGTMQLPEYSLTAGSQLEKGKSMAEDELLAEEMAELAKSFK